MIKTSSFKMIVSKKLPKEKGVAIGNYIIQDGKLYFKSGRDIVFIKEHFSDTNVTAESLLENTIRYDNENINTKSL